MADTSKNSPPHTVSHVFGEITWLLSQSPQHGDVLVSDLGWLAMPPILNRQFYIFRKGERPIGAALWAFLNAESQEKAEELLSRPRFELAPADWKSGPNLWLIALIAPFANPQNREAELMIADLIAGPFAGKPFRMIHTDPSSGERTILHVGADAKEQLVRQASERLSNGGLRQ